MKVFTWSSTILLPRANTSHFLSPRVDISPYFNGHEVNK